MRIDFVFDTVCPWCYIGKRRLDRALALRPSVKAEIRWRPFLLDPDLPPDGLDRKAFLARRYGSPGRIKRVSTAVMAACEAEGIAFNSAKMTKASNSLASHCLIWLAGQSDRQAEVIEALFAAYFCQGRDIGSPSVLRSIGESCGLDGDTIEECLFDGLAQSYVRADNTRVRRLGVTGVPCYIMDEAYALSGALEANGLVRLLDAAQERQWEPIAPALPGSSRG